ncbi:TetR/AcrR family transcriptional regulator [Williamsia phyllosphaerae]|uniref:HTH tetR-type domain-containing protein n=1 Tax=Williamsia phyllosphaerae TaxID=885042 RepID=A0ABQ1V1W6_9NOCA|nr:TetR/AcrR family transcriptional regulator [Williamsia phyllosphaerae]GGF32747.1 hypothetical protein GCM10007298_30810 [Williamsia phyllosphaerae]
MTSDAVSRPDDVRRIRGRPPGPGVDLLARRETLLDAAELAIGASGNEFSLGQVADLAGLTRSAVYAVFDDKNDLIASLTRRHTARITDHLGAAVTGAPDLQAATRAAVEVLVEWVENESSLAPVLMPQMHRGVGHSAITGYLETLLEQGFATLGSDVRAAGPWARALIGAISVTVGWWVRERTMDRDELVDHLTSLLWSGFQGAQPPSDP